MSRKKIIRAAPDWHAEAISIIQSNFEEIDTALFSATRRAIWLGLFLNHCKARGRKDKSIPHTQFGPWLEKHFPTLERRRVSRYMYMGKNAAEKAKIQIGQNVHFAKIADPSKLPAPIEKLIEGKTQQALFLEFKQAEELDDCEIVPKRGRRKGEGGNSAEHLAALRAAEEKARVEALELDTEATIKFLVEHSGPEGFPKINTPLFRKLCDALEGSWNFCRSLRDARKGTVKP